MAKKKAARVDDRPEKAKPKLEPVGDDKVRLTVEFYIEELVEKVTSGGGISIGCGCAKYGGAHKGCGGCNGCAGGHE
jgi:hypothetical protein